MSEIISWESIRDYFDDGNGVINDCEHNTNPECVIEGDIDFLEKIGQFSKYPYTIEDNALYYSGTNCMDFLDKIYKNGTLDNDKNYQDFLDWLSIKCIVDCPKQIPNCFVYKSDENAVLPTKDKLSDAGYDLTVIKVARTLLNNVTLYDTGIKINIQHGYYAEVVPRSSLSKSGYMLANSIGIIDANYRGNILIALIRVDESAPKLKLPFRCCQLIFKRQINMDMIEVKDDFESTSRNGGGFGSTGP
jgi:dUTP pyrophosphatase